MRLRIASSSSTTRIVLAMARSSFIRDGDGYFRTVETYLVGKSKIEFSHTICDDCVPRIYPELDDVLKN